MTAVRLCGFAWQTGEGCCDPHRTQPDTAPYPSTQSSPLATKYSAPSSRARPISTSTSKVFATPSRRPDGPWRRRVTFGLAGLLLRELSGGGRLARPAGCRLLWKMARCTRIDERLFSGVHDVADDPAVRHLPQPPAPRTRASAHRRPISRLGHVPVCRSAAPARQAPPMRSDRTASFRPRTDGDGGR